MGEDKERVLKIVKDNGVQFVALQFVDIFGIAKNCEIPAKRLEEVIDNGLWFDGSSIEGFMRIHESDMYLKPDLSTFAVIPFADEKVARIICDVYTDEKHRFEGDPRYVLQKALKKAEEAGFAYKVGPELEFFFFKDPQCDCNGNGGLKPTPEVHDRAGYFDLSPMDLATSAKRAIVIGLEAMGLEVEMHHHEVAPGQHEIDFKYGDALKIADQVITYKNTLKMISRKHGLFASFMPKPIFGINGSGMHVHQSLWKSGKNAFYDGSDKYKLSATAKSFIAGQLAHAQEFSAVTAPTVNSYKRLVPGYEAPAYICWARTNRSALIRVPRCQEGRESGTRIELRCPDPSCNPYLALSVMLYAGLDGVKNNLTPPEPVEEDVYHFDDKKLKEHYINTLPGSLGEASKNLSESKLMREALGEHVFGKLLEAQKQQWDDFRLRVTPWEIDTYLPVY
ncbi:type I glutamate--ammonia ligase [Candidatus Micrarchaeota archaeon]|nr:type I glutamate--ammonia ligase [Candidatus Micrarchaeota archaeon]